MMHYTLHDLSFLNTSRGAHELLFLGTLFIYACDNASAYRESLIKHIYENEV